MPAGSVAGYFPPHVRKASSGLPVEGHADPLFLAPHDVARQLASVRHQSELCGDPNRAGDIESRAGVGDIAHCAVDCPTAELDGSGFQYAMPGCNPVFIHRIEFNRACGSIAGVSRWECGFLLHGLRRAPSLGDMLKGFSGRMKSAIHVIREKLIARQKRYLQEFPLCLTCLRSVFCGTFITARETISE